MLVLSRRPGQVIKIGEDVFIEVLSVSGKYVRIGIKAPASVTIMRAELCQEPFTSLDSSEAETTR